MPSEKRSKCIVTANIPADSVYLQTRYYDLLMAEDAIKDNAGLMAIKFFISLGVKNFYLAGFDGYSYDEQQNYAYQSMEMITKKAMVDAMNTGMCKTLELLREKASIEFITQKKHIQ